MTIELGTTNINKLMLGSTEIKKAQLGLTTVYDKTGGGGGGSGSIQDIVAEAVFDLDATQSASYGGSGQTWANLVPNPHDGSTQTAWDVTLGTSSSAASDDPTFTGTAGTSGAYFAYDGGDMLSILSMPQYMREMHRTTAQFTMGFCLNVAASNQGLIGTGNGVSAGTGLAWLYQPTVPRVLLQVWGANDFSNNIISVTGTATGDLCLIIAVDAVNGTAKVFKNGTKFTGTYAGRGTSSSNRADAYLTSRYGSSGTTPSFPLTSGSRCRSIFLIDKYVTDIEAGNLLVEMNLRHGSIY